MRRWAALAAVVVLALLPLAVAGQPANPGRREKVIVVLARGENAAAVARRAGVRPAFLYENVINGFAAELPAVAIEALRRNPAVRLISPDLPGEGTIQPTPTGVNRIDADQSSLPGIRRNGGAIDADVAVLDTGIAAHPELAVAGGAVCIGRGTVDGNGHGTHVAGTIAARDNTAGAVGVAPGARLWAVKVLDASNSGTWSSVNCGLDRVYANRARIDVVNMSLTGAYPGADPSACAEDALHQAVCNVVDDAGIPVVAAAGNESDDAANYAPAAFDEVITVSSFADVDGQPGAAGPTTCFGNADDTFASYSNYGPGVDVAALGDCIRSTSLDGRYKLLSGTSMAAPHVTGAVALYLAKVDPAGSPADVRAWLLGPASRPQDAAQGFAGDRDAFPEPVLNLAGT